MNSALLCSSHDITWYVSHAPFVRFDAAHLWCLFSPFSALASKILLGASEVGSWYDMISLFCKTWCARVKTFPRGEKCSLTAVFARPWSGMLSCNEVEFEVLERNIPLYKNDVLVKGEELSCRLEIGERLIWVCRFVLWILAYIFEDSVLRRDDTAALGNQFAEFWRNMLYLHKCTLPKRINFVSNL